MHGTLGLMADIGRSGLHKAVFQLFFLKHSFLIFFSGI